MMNNVDGAWGAIDQLAAALVAAQAEFAAIPKTADNPFFKSKYADLATVISHTQPVLAKHGLAVSQHPTVDDGEPALTTMLIHSSGQVLMSKMRLCASKHDPQGQGAAITYARRFAYMAVLGLVADVDDDGNTASRVVVSRPRSAGDVAREEFAGFLKSNRLKPADYNARFVKDHGMDIREADAETVKAFQQLISQELEPGDG